MTMRTRPGADVLPLVVALAGREMAVQHGDADFLPDEARAEMLDRLRRERDFRHEDERAFSRARAPGDGLQIDLGLAAAGDAVEQHHARLGRGDFLQRSWPARPSARRSPRARADSATGEWRNGSRSCVCDSMETRLRSASAAPRGGRGDRRRDRPASRGRWPGDAARRGPALALS